MMRGLKGKTYNIITFGCQMNEHDSETMAGLLRGAGCMPVDDRRDADIVIINTCSVRENADKRFFGTLGQLKKQKAANPNFAACVCGCMMQQGHIVEQVRRRYPWVDLVFGTHNIDELTVMLEELYINRGERPDEAAQEYTLAKHSIRSSKDSRIIRVYEDRQDIVEGLPAERLFPHKAFVNIMFGCNNFCTYCIVPYTRGREKSRRPEDIIKEVTSLVEEGVREVTLLGQNVNSYRGETGDESCAGGSGPGGSWDFADLIYSLNEIEGLDRIRFMTSHPKDMSDRLITAYRDCEKLCKYVHLPVQAGSNRVLKKMNRKYDRERYLQLVRKLREACPQITISTDIIVGFPGETEEDFAETLDLVKEVRYDSAFTFLYSPRRGTPAADYTDQIPEDVKHRRFDSLVDVMNGISAEKNAQYVGKSFDVLVDGPARKSDVSSGEENTEEVSSDDMIMMSGRTDGFKLVDFKGSRSLTGKIIKVRITDSKTFSLTGELEEEF